MCALLCLIVGGGVEYTKGWKFFQIFMKESGDRMAYYGDPNNPEGNRGDDDPNR